MNFFEEQTRARRKTAQLVILMLLAVICLIIITALVAALFWSWMRQYQPSAYPYPVQLPMTFSQIYQQALFSSIPGYAAIAVVVTVAAGSLYKLITLQGPGCGVAEALGGRRIPSSTQVSNERKILNIVEEMAIASGNPVPAVYVLDEPGINAFAAGNHNRNAVIGISQGALDLLNREELQGVIAHEFSHIHYGDMRINIRLIALLHGILMLSLIGSFLMRSSGGRDDKKGGLIFAGVILWVLGSLGVFFGNMIKAAISRQREFLADASAVQFTRNPDGIANALRKIGGHRHHGYLESPSADEYSHLYFDTGVYHWLGSLTATHPPLPLRIQRILPGWDGSMITPKRLDLSESEHPKDLNTSSNLMMGAVLAGQAALNQLDSIGNPTKHHLTQAQSLIREVPNGLRSAAQDPFSARALIFCLLMETQNTVLRQQQLNHLKQTCDTATFDTLTNIQLEFALMPREYYLPLVELSMPALKSLSAQQYQTFKEQMLHIVRLDGQISLLEWCFFRIITANYENKIFNGQLKIAQVSDDLKFIFHQLAEQSDDQDRASAFAATEVLLPNMSLSTPPSTSPSINQLEKSVSRLEQLKPLEKPKLLKAMVKFIEHDGVITSAELELLRALADCIGCPLPLFNLATPALQ